ncbi:hypothetical protein CYY_003557 [Polysphondylium violaceum]|uniref:TNF receptor-associated factor family protein n=1 Tax=Polysphondylium violaceum TaxID=133409 RepID=A0A8J4V5T7_9MYCE|nr:hypothetical protein CYY_003557 [Polysphondylium violaceum]
MEVPIETLIIDQELIKELQCGICLQLLNTPRQCQNGHLFDLSCITTSLKKNKQCPICRCSLSSKELSRSLFVEKHIRNLKVYCKYHYKKGEPLVMVPTTEKSISSSSSSSLGSFHDDENWIIDDGGCDHISTFENLETHQNSCEFGFDQCKYSSNNSSSNNKNNNNNNNNNSNSINDNGNANANANGNSSGSNSGIINNNNNNENEKENDECGMIRKKDLENHYVNCPFRPTLCKYCEKQFCFKLIDDHIENCDMKPQTCDLCLVSIIKKDMESHLSDSCPSKLIDCPYSHFGCSSKFTRDNLNNHLENQTAMSQHLKFLLLQQTKKEEDFVKELEEKEDKIRRLEEALLASNGHRIEWKIKNVSKQRSDKYTQSESFIINGFTFFLALFWDGDTSESTGFVSTYLFLETSKAPKGKALFLHYFIEFQNQRDRNQSIQKEFDVLFPIKGGQGWGDRKAIKYTSLEKDGFIKDDTLIIRSDILVKKNLWSIDVAPQR